eukprot:jgi/Chlat1/7045/Chrsp56S06709
MNPLTQIKNTQKITAREVEAGLGDDSSWHAKYKDSAYVYVGGLPFSLTEGDLLAVFAQYGEIMDVNLVKDPDTGKSKGFAFLAYEDQRSTVLSVDNLNGAKVAGRIVKVDHVAKYKRKLEEDPEEKEKAREERGVCYAFQRGECKRGSACKFSHDLERHANTGWGRPEDKDGERWKNDRYDGPERSRDRGGPSGANAQPVVARRPVSNDPQPVPSSSGALPWEGGVFSILSSGSKAAEAKREKRKAGHGAEPSSSRSKSDDREGTNGVHKSSRDQDRDRERDSNGDRDRDRDRNGDRDRDRVRDSGRGRDRDRDRSRDDTRQEDREGRSDRGQSDRGRDQDRRRT